MFLEHHIPDNLADALSLLGRPSPLTVPLGRGVFLFHSEAKNIAVVDLQKLGLDEITHRGVNLEVGAMVSLAELAGDAQIQPLFKEVVVLEAPDDGRSAASLAGTLVVAGGSSPLTVLLLAMDARLELQPGEEEVFLGDFLPFREELLAGRMITRITIPVNVQLAFKSVSEAANLPPSVSVGLARWPSGRTRVALGGYGPHPILAFDSPEDSGIAFAVEDAFSRAGENKAAAAARQAEAVRLAEAGLAALK